MRRRSSTFFIGNVRTLPFTHQFMPPQTFTRSRKKWVHRIIVLRISVPSGYGMYVDSEGEILLENRPVVTKFVR